MRRYRLKRKSKRFTRHPAIHTLAVRSGGRVRQLESQWDTLHHLCRDHNSRIRLARLQARLASNDLGTLESAAAELESALLMVQAGFSVSFLPESQARTADLECYLGLDRLFVEVTTIVGVGDPTHLCAPWEDVEEELTEVERYGWALIRQVRARISEKARQLRYYCAPVVLAVTVPHRERPGAKRRALGVEVDLNRIAAAITVLMPLVRQVSGVLLSLWDVETSPNLCGMRLANVYMAERSPQQPTDPRARLLVLNPDATYPLNRTEARALKSLL